MVQHAAHDLGRLAFRQWLPWVLTLLVALLAVAVSKQVIRRHGIILERQSLEVERQRLEDRNAEIVKLLAYVKSSTYTEEQARLRFGLAREGEHLAVVPVAPVPESADGNTLNDQSVSQLLSLPNYLKWWRIFFH